MPKIKEFYVLSEEADFDIDEIFDYTEIEFGFNQAVSYVADFDTVFNHFLVNPNIGKSRNEIKKGLYSFPKGEHVIFYRILANYIRIVRVLHGSRDIPTHF